ncbi:MAG: alpha-E domain-containing protein [Firmicutes bacterium]|nr:alpha-E domain-containing protein [Bacillota bacterium]
MGTVTIERLDNLFWLGRYIERVYQTIQLYMEGYDHMIDEDGAYYNEICEQLGIPNIYTSSEDFINSFGFDRNNSSSIISNAYRAYDNAMVMRDEISTKTLAYIHLVIANLEKAKNSVSPMLELQSVLDNILAFWGCLDDEVDEESTRNAVKVGKRIERLDLYLRAKKPREELVRETDRLEHRVKTTNLKYNKAALKHVSALIEDEPIDYREALSKAMLII